MEICRYMNHKEDCNSTNVNLDYCFNGKQERCGLYRKFRREDGKEIESISNRILGAVERIILEIKG